MIKLQNLYFSYLQNDNYNLKDINLEVKKGEVVALIGSSGCGKTSLTRIINGLAYKFYEGNVEGSILIDGMNPYDKELYEIGKKVGSIFQNPKSQFFAELVEDEIAFGLENNGVEAEKISGKIESALDSINGKKLIDKNLFQLSSGEKQKVAIASINAIDPPIYVFDEPSANLDMESVESLKGLMSSLKKAGKTMVISEHRIYYLRGIVDKYYFIENGEITACYTEEELSKKSSGEYEKLGLRTYELDSISPTFEKINGKNTFKLEELYFSYKGKEILENLNYSFVSGNIYGIVGENGIGKSSLSKILSGLLREKKGAIYYNDRKLKKSDRRRIIYYLSTNPDSNLFEVTPEEELKLNDIDVDAKKILEDFQLENTSDLHPQILSGGQKQRLTIAAAELLEREVYIFDEPTSGLDGKNMHLIANKIKELKKKNKIVIVISHDYEFLMESCNRILSFNGSSLEEISDLKDEISILDILKGNIKI
ncbi:MAG: ABC transporter ATP-binding protein [Peptostreptococcus sp.]|uniref:ABC transporter ATP-binding protein n=1 Tax=Peptostreptococcus sp. TaxID=1262 RepID=UPI002FC94010